MYEIHNPQKKPKEEKSFIQLNFETIIILLKIKVNSYEKALFLIFTCFLLLLISNMNTYG